MPPDNVLAVRASNLTTVRTYTGVSPVCGAGSPLNLTPSHHGRSPRQGAKSLRNIVLHSALRSLVTLLLNTGPEPSAPRLSHHSLELLVPSGPLAS